MSIKITDEQLREAVIANISVRGVLKSLGLRLAGGSHSHYSKRILNLNIDTSHFLGKRSNLHTTSPRRKSASEVLVKRLDGGRQKHNLLKRCMIESGLRYECSKCKLPDTWLGNPITLDIDHISEDWLDDRIENLRFLCPNCHSQFSRNLIKNKRGIAQSGRVPVS